MQVFNYQGPTSYMFLLDWLFPFVAFHWCVFRLDGDGTLERAYFWSSGFISAIQSKQSKTQAIAGTHMPQAERPDESKQTVQMKVTHQGKSWERWGSPWTCVSQDTHHL